MIASRPAVPFSFGLKSVMLGPRPYTPPHRETQRVFIQNLNIPVFSRELLSYGPPGFDSYLPLICLTQKVQVELDGLKKDLNKVSVKTQDVLSAPQPSPSAPVLRSELELTVQKMDHAHNLSSVYLEK